jgi:hypothetical protein
MRQTSCLLVTFPTAPHTEIIEKGEIVYSEVNRKDVRKLEAYVEQMVSADHISDSDAILMFYDILFGHPTTINREITAHGHPVGVQLKSDGCVLFATDFITMSFQNSS